MPPDTPADVCSKAAQAHGPTMDDLVQKMCLLHQEALVHGLTRVADMVERLMPRTKILMGLTSGLAPDTQNYLRQFRFLMRYRKLDDRQMVSVLQQLEASEQSWVHRRGKRSRGSEIGI